MYYKSTILKYLFFISCFLLLSLLLANSTKTTGITENTRISSAAADASLLKRRYEQWKSQKSDELVQFKLVSATQHQARVVGHVSLSAKDKLMRLELVQQANNAAVDIWVTSNQQALVLEDQSDNAFHLTRLDLTSKETSSAELDVSPLLERGLKIGQVIVMPVGEKELGRMIAGGSPSLFQRLYTTELALSARSRAAPLARISNLFVPLAVADEATGFPDIFDDIVAMGEEIFFNETFDGNGRTCGTCHPATNNFTIDVPFINSLPDDDPLFVAEFVPALMFGNPANLDETGKPQRFENPALMRGFGLIVENIDGFSDVNKRFTMRSVPHNIGLSVSLETPPTTGVTPPADRTGWSGDGAPSGLVGGVMASGRLKDFLLGAIVQHYPKTMARRFDGPNPDFRIATLDEMDAVAAFMLALGRDEELNISEGDSDELILADASAENGRVLFREGAGPGSGTCNGCHANAGANAASQTNPGNRNFNTGVEEFLQNRLQDPDFNVVGQARPLDGGFGTTPSGEFLQPPIAPNGFEDENFGDNTFNSVSLVEAADTPPFFHNNIANTLEEAIEFYNSQEFSDSAANPPRSIPFTSTQVRDVANFLRVINALDNLENSVLRQANRAIFALNQNPRPDDVITRIIDIMIADAEDAIQVLNEGDLHNSGPQPQNVVRLLEQAVQRLNIASSGPAATPAKINHINFAMNNVTTSIGLMRVSP